MVCLILDALTNAITKSVLVLVAMPTPAVIQIVKPQRATVLRKYTDAPAGIYKEPDDDRIDRP